MSSESVTIGNVKLLLESFDKFVKMCETDNWLSDISVEGAKSVFKLGLFVENAIKNLTAKNSVNEFKDLLHSWWRSRGRSKTYDLQYFSIALDYVLKIFFTNNVDVNMLDIAVRIYTSMLTKERLEAFLTKLILESTSFEAIVDYTISNKDLIDLKELESRLMLHSWSNDIECGAFNKIKDVILNMLGSYKIDWSLPIIICMLSLDNISDEENNARKLILENVLIKMKDRTILSREFWLSMFRKVDKKSLAIVCTNYQDFLTELLNFIVYIGCMMNCEIHPGAKLIWKADPNSICPELTYDDLASVIKHFSNHNETLITHTKNRFSSIDDNVKLWKQLNMYL